MSKRYVPPGQYWLPSKSNPHVLKPYRVERGDGWVRVFKGGQEILKRFKKARILAAIATTLETTT